VTASVLFNSGTIEISGFINGIDIVAEDKLLKLVII
jgi:lipoprotein-releasing system permease protein